jgi:hypothetical protein
LLACHYPNANFIAWEAAYCGPFSIPAQGEANGTLCTGAVLSDRIIYRNFFLILRWIDQPIELKVNFRSSPAGKQDATSCIVSANNRALSFLIDGDK